MAYDAGSAHIQVIPSFRNWEGEVRKQLNLLGRQLAGAFDDSFSGKLGEDLKKVADQDLPRVAKAVEDTNQRSVRSTEQANQQQAQSYGNLYDGIAKLRQKRAEDDIKAFDRERRGAQQVADDRLAAARKEIDARSRAAAQAREREFAEERRAAQQVYEVRLQSARKEIADREKELNASRERQVRADEEAFRRTTAGRAQAGVTAAGESIQKIKVEADTSEADRKLQEIRAELVALGDKRIGVNIAVNDFIGQVERQFAELEALAHDQHVDINVRVDAARAATELGGILVLMNRIDGDKAEVQVGVDAGAALAGLAALQVSLGRLGLQIAAVAALGTGLVPLFAGAAGTIGAVGTAAAAVGAGIGVMVLGFSGIGTAVKAMQQLDLATAKTAKSLGAARTALANATDGVRSAEAALANTRANNADAAVRAEQSVRDAVRGVEQAEREVGKAAADVGRARQDAARQVQDAQQRVADTERELTRAVQDAARAQLEAARQVADAQQRVADTERTLARAVRDVAQARQDAARSVRDAEDRVAEAEVQHTRAIIDVQRAQEDLNQAYVDARRDLEDLNSSIKSNSLDQRQAVLDIADAQKELNLLRANPRATQAEIEQATIRLEREQLGLEDLKRREQDLAAARAEADAKGIEGSDKVVSAQEKLAEAQQRVADTQKAQEKAAQDLSQARIDAAQRVADAQQRVSDAQRENARAEQDLQRARIDAAQKVADAQQRISDAQRAQARAEQDLSRARIDAAQKVVDAQTRLADAQRGVADAQRRVADAERAQEQQRRQAAFALQQATQAVVQAQRQAAQASLAMGAAGGEALSNLNDAMSQLSPTAQRFARFIYGLKGRFLELRAAASDGMLSGLQKAIESLMPGFPALVGFVKSVSDELGRLFQKSADLLKDPIFVQFFTYIRDNTVPMLEDLFTIASNVAKGLVGLFLGFTPLTGTVTDSLVQISAKFADWGTHLANDPGWQKFIGYIQANMPLIGALLLEAGKFVLRFVEAAAPIGSVVLKAFVGLFQLLNKIPIDALTALIAAVAGVAGALSILSGITSIALLGLAPLIAALAVGLVVAAIVAIAAIKPVRDWFVNVFQAIAAAGKWMWEVVLRPIFSAIGTVLKGMWNTFLYPTAQVFKTVFGIIAQAAQWLWANVIKPVVTFIGNIFRNWLAPIIRWLWAAVIKPTFAVIKVGFDIFSAIVKVAAGLFQINIKIMAAVFGWLWKNVLSPIWNNSIKPLFVLFGAFIGKYVAPKFKAALQGLAEFWRRWSGYFKAPIRFVVDTVINGGLLGTYNKIAKFFNVKPDNVSVGLPKSFSQDPPPLRLATGGIMPGYTPGRDVHQFYSPTGGLLELSGGEPVLRPEVGRVLGSDWVYGVNAAARRGGTDAVEAFLGGTHKHARGGLIQSFASGGIFDKIGNFVSNAKDKVGDFFATAKDKVASIVKGVGDFLSDPLGTVRKLAEKLLDQIPHNRIGNVIRNLPIKVMDWGLGKVKAGMAAMASLGSGGGGAAGITANASPGFPPWPSGPGAQRGDSGVWRKVVALIKSTGPVSGSFGNSYRPGDPLWHGSGRAVDWMGYNQDSLATFLAAHRPLELIHRTKRRDYAYTRGRNKGTFNQSLMNAHKNHVHIAMKLGGLLPQLRRIAMKLGGMLGFTNPVSGPARGGDGAALQPLSYDSGGWLRDTRNLPGQTVQVFHGRREPDAVLSNQQWRVMATLAGQSAVGGPRTVNNYQFRDTTLTLEKLTAMERRRDAIERVGRPR